MIGIVQWCTPGAVSRIHSDAAVKLRRDEKYESVFLRFYANACVLAQRGFISQTFYDKGMLELFHFMAVKSVFWHRKRWKNSLRKIVYTTESIMKNKLTDIFTLESVLTCNSSCLNLEIFTMLNVNMSIFLTIVYTYHHRQLFQ